ncbi:hypothetical protein HDU87_008834 [Geranomyces variabilis]|uniref:Uncharacterized protein n=1 Tax=Geranomyces variabilis TaxID=109894 RepID=A0AAD5TEU8_9FUNG|nr:hypothetical protein HDU87_008834 [Geranomyces variabilis]
MSKAAKASISLKSTPSARPVSLATELAQAKNQITNFRENIDLLEKTFRENVLFKRVQFQPYAIFSSDVPLTSLADDEEYANEMIGRAKAEVLRQSGQKKKLEEENANQKLDGEQYLRRKITETREKFRAKKALLEAGPKFVHYFCSTYGEVMHVHALGARLYVVFASNNWLEFWEFDAESSTPHLRDVEHLAGIDAVATVCHLFSDDRPLQSENGDDDEDGDEHDSVGPSDSAPSRRASATSSANTSRHASMEQMPITNKPASKALWGAPDPGSKRRISARTRVIGNVPEEDDAGTIPEEGEDATAGAGVQRPVSARNESMAVAPEAPLASITITQHTFFLGCTSGAGSTFVIDVTWERETDVLTYVHSICSTRTLSLHPIKLACFVEYDDTIVCQVSHTGMDQVLAAYSLELEDVWQCKGDVLKYTAKDKQLKVIAQTRLDVVRERSRGTDIDRPTATVDDSFISCIRADVIHKHLLVAMRSGAILRLNCETVTVHTGGARERPDPSHQAEATHARRASLTSDQAPVMLPPPPPVLRKDLFVAWCLETQPLPSKSLAPSRHAGKGGDELSGGAGKPAGKAVYSFRGGPEITTRHMTTFFHTASSKPYLLLCCTDGTLRMYPMDMGLATAAPVVYTYTDQDREPPTAQGGGSGGGSPSEHLALVWADGVTLADADGEVKQFLVAYTADGIFVIYSPLNPKPLLEKRILSNRAASLFANSTPSPTASNSSLAADSTGSLDPQQQQPPRGARGAPAAAKQSVPASPAVRRCRMLEEAGGGSAGGLCVITAGREWGLVDMRNLKRWEVAGKDGEPARRANTASSATSASPAANANSNSAGAIGGD